jgi:hypothetical protein
MPESMLKGGIGGLIAGIFVIILESLISSILWTGNLNSWGLQDFIRITAWEVVWTSILVLPFAAVGGGIGGLLGERYSVNLPHIVIGVIVGTVVAICFGGLCFWIYGSPVIV